MGVAVPGVVAPGVFTGLTSADGGCESPAGPTLKLGGNLGWLGTAPDISIMDFGRTALFTESRAWAAAEIRRSVWFSDSRGGESCGVKTAGSWRPLLKAPDAPIGVGFTSLEAEPAGVSGGECITEVGGEILGVDRPD